MCVHVCVRMLMCVCWVCADLVEVAPAFVHGAEGTALREGLGRLVLSPATFPRAWPELPST